VITAAKERGIFQTGIIPLKKLHLTLLSFRLEEYHIPAILDCMAACQKQIDASPHDVSSTLLEFDGQVNTFGRNVVYLQPLSNEATAYLEQCMFIIKQTLTEWGLAHLLAFSDRNFIPHVTLIQSSKEVNWHVRKALTSALSSSTTVQAIARDIELIQINVPKAADGYFPVHGKILLNVLSNSFASNEEQSSANNVVKF
jgi:2'-5' RNA ligase